MQAAHGLANFIIGGRGYGAGVDDDQASFGGGRGGGESFRGQAGFDGGSVGLGGAAAEVFYPESIHCINGSWRRAGPGLALFWNAHVCPHAYAWRFSGHAEWKRAIKVPGTIAWRSVRLEGF
jgi:hypothetical protein